MIQKSMNKIISNRAIFILSIPFVIFAGQSCKGSKGDPGAPGQSGQSASPGAVALGIASCSGTSFALQVINSTPSPLLIGTGASNNGAWRNSNAIVSIAGTSETYCPQILFDCVDNPSCAPIAPNTSVTIPIGTHTLYSTVPASGNPCSCDDLSGNSGYAYFIFGSTTSSANVYYVEGATNVIE